MSVKSPSRVFMVVALHGCCLLALLCTSMPFKTAAQQDCTAPTFQSQASAWEPNARISVNINANQFTPAQFNCLKTAFDNWNDASGNGGNQLGRRIHGRLQHQPDRQPEQ